MQLIKTEYFYAKKGKNKKYGNDKMVMVLKDENGNKVRKKISNTKITYYVTKEEYWDEIDDPYIKYIDRDKVRPVTTLFSQLENSMVKELDDPEFTRKYNSCFDDRANIRNNLRELHLDNRLHGTDIYIDDYYIAKYLKSNPYEKNNFGLTKVFFDIEVDSSDYKGFPEEEKAECPINAISMVDGNNKVINGYFLKYEDNEGYNKFQKRIQKFLDTINDKYDNEFDVNLYFFDEEIELIASFFDYINDVKPDFGVAWNMDFDFVYIVNRISRLNYEPKEIMCPEDIPIEEKQVYYRIDDNPQHDISDKHSMYICSGYTNYIDLMALYANITKPLGKEESYSLDYIASKVCGIHKEEVVGNMKTFHLIDFKSFAEYSLQDSYALYKIDAATSHIDLLYTVSMLTTTKIENAMKKTVCIKNMIKQYAEKRGQIQSNNKAKLYQRPTEKIPGAYVASTSLIDNVGYMMNGTKSNTIFECVTDLDLSSLYPSINRAFNMSSETLIGYLEYKGNNGLTGIDFLTDYIVKDEMNFCNKYFNLPCFDDLEDMLDERLNVA